MYPCSDLYLNSTNIRSEVSSTVLAMSTLADLSINRSYFLKNAELMNIRGASYEYFGTFSGKFIIYN